MRLRILSYNIHRAIGVDRRFLPERIAEVLAVHDADIALLQEVDEGVPRSRELDLARVLAARAGYEHVAVGHNVSLRRGRYGNATLSRYPILRERNIDLSIGRRKRRGCQYTEMRVDGRGGRRHRLDVFNLHLGLSARERQQQVGLLIGAQEFGGLRDDGACLVGGDFNDWRSLLAPIFTGVLNFHSATDRSPGARGALRTYPSFFPRGPLDRIFYRGSLALVSARRCRLRVSRVASDHLPIVADFELLR
jgi:endonuclease/exonuclease/phosphatase family metal-dependent hydrolase